MADLIITESQVQPGAGARVQKYTAGVAIEVGEWVYFDTADNKVKLADADSSSLDVRTALGCAVGAAEGDLQQIGIQIGGTLILGAGAAPVGGELYCLSDVPGKIGPRSDRGVGDYIQFLGVGGGSNDLLMSIFNSQVQL